MKQCKEEKKNLKRFLDETMTTKNLSMGAFSRENINQTGFFSSQTLKKPFLGNVPRNDSVEAKR